MQITYYGHSCFLVEAGGKRLLFDPFMTGNPLATGLDVNAIRCDFIFVTHAHQDHIGDLEIVAANNPNVLLVGIWEVSAYYSAKGLRTHPMNKDRIIGCHFDTFGFIKIDHEAAQNAFLEKGKELLLMKPGEKIDI